MARHGEAFVRHLMARFRRREIRAEDGAEELGISARWFRRLWSDYLRACAEGREVQWRPGRSGGDHCRPVPEVHAVMWRQLLEAKPPAPYNFVASETLRRFGVTVDRATVRRWAMEHGLTHPRFRPQERAAVRRWQCQEIGALWQLDVTPHHWFGPETENLPLFDMVDDCSRLVPAARLYPRECLLAYLDFLPRGFDAHGLPVALYVDYHSFFFSHIPDNLTYLAEALRFYGISLRYAPTPQAKGKVERLHYFWQNRLPSYFNAEGITTVRTANEHLDPLRVHHNETELHRELGMTPAEAWEHARREGRSVLRPRPHCPWWSYIWSVRTPVRVDLHGTVPAGTQRLRINASFGRRVIQCQHPDGTLTYLANHPGSGGPPIVLLRYECCLSPWNV
jgi:hypothetical protein